MEGGLPMVSARLGRNLIAAALTALALLLVASVGASDASAKGKKVHACVVKKGPDRGVMRFSKKGKCHKGEKKLSWNKKGKKGKRGKQGAAGQTGPTGPTGPQGPSGVTDQLLQTIASQETTIDSLKSQLDTVTSQLGGLSPQVAALCTQMSAVTTYANALAPVISGISLSGIIPGGLGLTVPALPTALTAFSCP
jgi:hypothetical protein